MEAPSGTRSSSTMIVIRMAMTPSLNASRRVLPMPPNFHLFCQKATLGLAPGAHRGRPGIDGMRGDEPVPAAAAGFAAPSVDVEPELIAPWLSGAGAVIPEGRALRFDRA